MAANGHRPMTPRQLAEDEQRIDQVRGRRYCRVHRNQQMIPLLPGVDVCPACAPEGESRTQRPSTASPQPEEHRVSESKKTVDAAKGRRDRDSKETGASTPKEKQEQVSTNLHEKGYREGQRFYGG
jgi:hypothetical protein